MNGFLAAMQPRPLLSDGAMGSYIFELTGRLSEANHVYESLSVDAPELIQGIHLAYLQAGARCVTTNTFGANPSHLAQFDLANRVEELNRASVRLARQAIEEFVGQNEGDEPYFVLGSIGPTLAGNETPLETREIYRDQLGALVDEGVDALQLETFGALTQLTAVMGLIQELDEPPPMIVHMALDQTDADGSWNQDPAGFVKTVAELGAVVVGVNCCAPWTALTFIDAVESLDVVSSGSVRLSVMPNAGGFQRIGNRYMTHVNPEYMGSLARTLSERNVRLIGGCCEVHPDHLLEMHNYLHGRGGRSVRFVSDAGAKPVGDEKKKGNGSFSRKVKEGKFTVSVELLPTRGTAPKTLQSKVDLVARLAESGLADGLDLTDMSRGVPLMPPGDFITVLRERLGWSEETGDGLELIPHLTTRDLNTMGLQTRLLGYWATRIHNVIVITGDPPKMSPTYPRSTAVFDLDSVDLINYIHSCLNAGVDFGGRPLGRHSDPRTHFSIGTGFEPEALDLDRETDRLRQKIDGGADYIMTQPAFRQEPLDILNPFRDNIPILVGVLILTGLDHARRMAGVPGVVIPETVFDRFQSAPPGEQAAIGTEIAAEQIRWIRQDGWSGVYLMSPATHDPIIDVLRTGLDEPS